MMLNCAAGVLVAMCGAATATRPASAPAATQPVRTFTYKTTPQAKLALYVHLPPGWKETDRRAGVVFFFGGGWLHGSAEQFIRQADDLARRGMVAARADYRVFERHGVTPDQCVEDAFSAVRWMRAHARELGVDPQRIVASGGSAGAHMAACTALCAEPQAEGEDRSISPRPNALVLFNPVLDLSSDRAVRRLKGDPELARSISPYHHLRRNAPPTLILFGSKDRLAVQAPPYIAKAKELGNRVDLYTAEGEGHGFFNASPWFERTVQRMDDFFVEIGYLSPQTTSPAR